MKDFQSHYQSQLNPGIQQHDPYIYTTPAVLRQAQSLKQTKMVTEMIKAGLLSVLIAPLQTITTSLQLSIQPHKNISTPDFFKQNNNISANAKVLSKVNTNLTLQQKRKLQLQIRSQQYTPYTAPVYSGYRETVRELIKQGWRAFFKGTMFRTVHSVLHIYPLYMMSSIVDEQNIGINPLFQFFKLYALKVGMDIITNCFQIGQNRYILQNNIKQFRVYRSGWKFLKKLSNRREVWKGYKFHFINNLVEILFKIPLSVSLVYSDIPKYYLVIPYYLSQVIIYPITTAYRRFICQCSVTPGMIPLRYESIYHCLKVTFFEEGLKGLWRGFLLYHLTIAIRLTFPLILQFNTPEIQMQI